MKKLAKLQYANHYDEYFPTITLDKFSKEIYLNDSKIVKTIVWDISGQESYLKSILKLKSEIEGIILVFDVTNRKSFDNLDGWITLIKENCKNPIIILFANKDCEYLNNCKVTEEEIDSFCEKNKLKYFRTSAKLDIGIYEGFPYIVNKIYDKRKIYNEVINLKLK